MNYYDKVLLAIPLVIISGVGTSSISNEIGLTTAVFFSSLFAVFVIGHAMFVKPPHSSSAQSR